MTSCTYKLFGSVRLLVFSLALPWGCFCGERDEVIAKGWTLELLIERFGRAEKKSVAYDLAHPPSNNWGGNGTYFCMLVNNLGKLGDRAALPFLEEKSRMTNAPGFIRSRAALAYVKIATAEECIGFLPKILALNDDKGHWRYGVTSKLLDKIDAAMAAHEISNEALTNLLSALLTYTQSTAFSTEAEWVDNFLVKHCDGYRTSEQRLFLWSGIVKAGNELERNHFLPIKEAIEAVPEKQRTDLHDRFPGLPPLPEDKADRSFSAITLAVGAALIAACAAILIALKRRRTRNHADGHPNNLR